MQIELVRLITMIIGLVAIVFAAYRYGYLSQYTDVKDTLVDFQHFLIIDGALDIDEDEVEKNVLAFMNKEK